VIYKDKKMAGPAARVHIGKPKKKRKGIHSKKKSSSSKNSKNYKKINVGQGH
jgi:hypothetical protein